MVGDIDNLSLRCNCTSIVGQELWNETISCLNPGQWQNHKHTLAVDCYIRKLLFLNFYNEVLKARLTLCFWKKMLPSPEESYSYNILNLTNEMQQENNTMDLCFDFHQNYITHLRAVDLKVLKANNLQSYPHTLTATVWLVISWMYMWISSIHRIWY